MLYSKITKSSSSSYYNNFFLLLHNFCFFIFIVPAYFRITFLAGLRRTLKMPAFPESISGRLMISYIYLDCLRVEYVNTVNSLFTDTSIRWTPLQNGHLELVPAFLYSPYLTLHKTDFSLRRTHSTGPKGVRLRES